MDDSGLETIVKKEPGTGKVLAHMTKEIAQDLYSKVTDFSKTYIFGNLPADLYEKLYSEPRWRESVYAKEMTTFSGWLNIPLYIAAGAVVGLTTATPTVPGAVACGIIGAIYGLLEQLVREGTVRSNGCHSASLPGWLLSIPLKPAVNTAVYIREHYKTAKRELTKQ